MKHAVVLITSVLLLTACGSSGSDPAPASEPSATASVTASAPTTEATQATGVVVDIAIKDGKATPQGKRVDVKVGETVTLDVTADADEEIHVHSDPEHTYEVAAGDSISESFTLDTPGQVAVEAHHLDVTIVQLVVRP